MRGVLALALFACASPQPPPGSAGPEEAVKEFAAAVQKGDATTAWSLLSTGTQQKAAFQFVSPYRGLSSFGEQDADLFFGRRAEVNELVQILRWTHLPGRS